MDSMRRRDERHPAGDGAPEQVQVTFYRLERRGTWIIHGIRGCLLFIGSWPACRKGSVADQWGIGRWELDMASDCLQAAHVGMFSMEGRGTGKVKRTGFAHRQQQ